MNIGIITLTTDFGPSSPYAAVMKGVILAINPAAQIVDITHAIRPQDVRHGALVLEDTTEWFPPDTIHVAVVDPGVGTGRTILYARIGAQQYIAPDNGLLSRLISRTPPAKIIRLANAEFWRRPVSPTFHGRDIMAPVAARLSLGLDPARLGPAVEGLVEVDWPGVQVSDSRIEGRVLEIDSFGNLITNITADVLAGRPTDTRVCVVCGIYETWGIYRTYGDQPQGTLVAVVGSHGRVELAIVGDNCAARLGVSTGTPVVVAWE
jgi:S-adenosyl-L-methionine hydrolase (adenosine-forming)